MKVLIIAEGGHGPRTPGKRTPKFDNGSFIHEHEFNYPTSCKFLELCKNVDFEVLNVSAENYDVSLRTRTDRANQEFEAFMAQNPSGICLFVSFHFNARNGKFDSKKGGIDVHYYPGAKDSKMFAQYVQNELIKNTKMYNRGIKANDFHVLRKTSMPAILCECGFMDKLEEAKLMLDENYQSEVATETFNGVLSYLKEEHGVIVQGKKKSYQEEIREATTWAKKNNISDCARLKENCTREEMIVMLHRLDKLIGGKLI